MVETKLRSKSPAWGRIIGGVGVVCLAFAATRATHLIFESTLINWPGPMGSGSFDIVHGRGVAPEQYHYLPHLLAVLLAKVVGFKIAVNALAFLSLSAFFFVVLYVAWPGRSAYEKVAVCAFVAFFYPISMFFGARFDTSLFLFLMMIGLWLADRPFPYLLLIAAFSAARADYALILALFVLADAFECRRKDIAIYVAAVLVPLGVQILFWIIFASSAYYTKVLTFEENFSGEVLKSPGLWYAIGLAALLFYLAPAKRRDEATEKRTRVARTAKLATLCLYVLCIVAVGRLRELRLLLPALPLVLVLVWGPAYPPVKHARGSA